MAIHVEHAGRAYNIVVAERVALNFMQRMSGIATLTKVVHCSLYSTLKGKIICRIKTKSPTYA